MSKIIAILLYFSLATGLFASSQIVKGGVITDGLDLSAVEIGEHSGYTRIVFYANYWVGEQPSKAGKPAESGGFYTFILSDDGRSIQAELSGYRSSSIKDIETSKYPNIISIKPLLGEEYGDDSSLFYQIKLAKPSTIKAFTLKDPARVVLDILE